MAAADTLPPEPGFERRPATLFATVALTFVALFAAALLLPHDPYIRFQQLRETIQFRSRWVYERVALDPTPIHVAVVGNSRLGAGVSAPQVQSALRRLTGEPIAVANLTMPQEGRNVHYAIVKRLLDRRPEVKLIILSAIEQMPREGHPAFRDLADARDVLAAPMLLNRDYANDVAVLPFRQMSLWLRSIFPAAFGDDPAFNPAGYAGPDYDSTESFFLPDGRLVDRDSIRSDSDLAAAADRRLRGMTPPLLPARQADYEFAVERAYTRAIADMARARGVSVMFLYLPIYRNRAGLADQRFYDRIGPTVTPGFVRDDYRLFSDYGHLNRHGARAVAPWLAERVATLSRQGRIRPLDVR